MGALVGGVNAGDQQEPAGRGPAKTPPEDLSEVLASIRKLVSAETAARLEARGASGTEGVLMLTPEMRIDLRGSGPMRSGEILAEGIGEDGEIVHSAPILDEEALRRVINAIIREELQGELGDRISRNLRKLIRREIAEVMAEQQHD
jgi:hypothetical protein